MSKVTLLQTKRKEKCFPVSVQIAEVYRLIGVFGIWMGVLLLRMGIIFAVSLCPFSAKNPIFLPNLIPMNLAWINSIAFASIFIAAGIAHFAMPRFFLHIMPKWVPSPRFVNLLVGAIEISLGIALLFPATQKWAAWALIALLIAVFPANVYHFQRSRDSKKYYWPTLLRLPVQALLIYWAYTFTT